MTVTDRTDSLIKQMTLDEKILTVEGLDSWYTHPIERLGIPSLFLTDGPHGLRRVKHSEGGLAYTENEHSTSFPCSATVASSWNPDNSFKMAAAIGSECLEAGVGLLLAPAVNIKRNPLCGRDFEYFSEDPLISGKFGAAFVDGLDSVGVGSCVKHFACNSSENNRIYGNSIVDERAFREIYLKAFEYIIKHSKPSSVMCAYNRINDTFCSDSKPLLTDILRDEWGFDGLVMSDWGAVHDRVSGLLAGCDLEMPGGVLKNRERIRNAVESGKLPMEKLDEAVKNILETVFKYTGKPHVKCNEEDNIRTSCEIATDSAVLLKNNGALPLDIHGKLLVIGEMFDQMRYQGAGSSLINPKYTVTPRNAFDSRGISYSYHKGYHSFMQKRDKLLETAALEAAQNAETVLFFGGLTDFEECEGFDRENMLLPENQEYLINKLIEMGKKVIFVLFSGSPVRLDFTDGLSAVLYMGLPGMLGGEATAKLLFGEVSPSGKLAESWPQKASDLPFANAPFNETDTVCYESVYVGYRYYEKASVKPLFPFGYGLSYSDFEYSDLGIVRNGEKIGVTAVISNVGKYDAAETVELYVENPQSDIYRPLKELRGFTKVYLKAGESKKVSIEFEIGDLAFWDTVKKRFTVEDGEYTVMVGSSSDTILLRSGLTIDGYGKCSVSNAEVSEYYRLPPSAVPPFFYSMCGAEQAVKNKKLSLESPIRSFRRTLSGKLIYAVAVLILKKSMKKASKTENPIERGAKLKNINFILKSMPNNNLRSLCMSSDGILDYESAEALTAIGSGHWIRGIRIYRLSRKKHKNENKKKFLSSVLNG